MTDTSKEAVKRLALRAEDFAQRAKKHDSQLFSAECQKFADTLRALLAERDMTNGVIRAKDYDYDRACAERDVIAAAAFEAAADLVARRGNVVSGMARDQAVSHSDAILRLTPADALAHLKAIEAKAEARGLREAAELARHGHHSRTIFALADEREKGTGHD